MTSSIVAPQPATRSRTVIKLAAFTPLWLLVVTAVGSTALSVVFSKPPDILGVPLGVVIDAIALLWMLGGVAIIWRAGSALAESLALMFFTIPATVVVVFAPAAIEMMQTLG